MNKKKKHKRKKFVQKLRLSYRLVVLNEDTFEEKLSFKINRLNTFVASFLAAFLLILLTTLLIAFTPLREYIPGYSSSALKRKAVELRYELDSLKLVQQQNENYVKSIKTALTGEDEDEVETTESYAGVNAEEFKRQQVEISEQDSVLRQIVLKEDRYNLMEEAINKANFSLYPPVKGTVTSHFNPAINHFAIDISTNLDEPVKATDDGTVIFAEWTAETGYVIIIEHRFALISVYKHNQSLLKKQGETVEAGEVIATTGNTGELTTGAHLHFELWSDGYPIDPTEFINFD